MTPPNQLQDPTDCHRIHIHQKSEKSSSLTGYRACRPHRLEPETKPVAIRGNSERFGTALQSMVDIEHNKDNANRSPHLGEIEHAAPPGTTKCGAPENRAQAPSPTRPLRHLRLRDVWSRGAGKTASRSPDGIFSPRIPRNFRTRRQEVARGPGLDVTSSRGRRVPTYHSAAETLLSVRTNNPSFRPRIANLVIRLHGGAGRAILRLGQIAGAVLSGAAPTSCTVCATIFIAPFDSATSWANNANWSSVRS